MTPQRFQGRTPTAVLFILLPAVSAQATTLPLDEALQLAERNAPSLQARQEQASAARNLVIPAGELPDPRLNLGVQNLPIEGADRWSLNRDFMTMQVVGLSQDVPNRDKRKARVETAQATVERADAEAVFERLKIRAATAQAWVNAYTVQRKLEQFDAFYKENQLLASTVRARLAGGAGSTTDTLAPKQELAQLDEQKDVLLSQAAQARSALKRWIGQDAEVGAPTFPLWPVDAAEYLQRHDTRGASPGTPGPGRKEVGLVLGGGLSASWPGLQQHGQLASQLPAAVVHRLPARPDDCGTTRASSSVGG